MFGKTIFKRDTTGALRSWQYEVDGDRWRSHSGLVGGAIVTSGWTTCVPRSRPTAEEQAVFEAEAEAGKKLAKDYALTEADVDTPRDAGAPPMLAQKYAGWTGPSYSQPKLDGIRCIANRFGLWTRTGKPILGVPHIQAVLGEEFSKYPDLVLDGELYNHELKDDFNQISSLVRKTKPSEEDIAASARVIQYHLYDLPAMANDFEHRFDVLDQLVYRFRQAPGGDVFRLVETTFVHDLASLDELYGEYLEDGYEGQMVRARGGFYEAGRRSKTLLKRKEFEDAEFPIVRIEEGNGNWAGMAKRVTVRLPDGRECGGGIRGSQQAMRDLLAKADILVGRSVTMRYLKQLTPDGMLRHAVAVDFHGAEGRVD